MNQQTIDKLTPELLSEVLGEKIEGIRESYNATNYLSLSGRLENGYWDDEINLDTLTIKMMNYIKSKGYFQTMYIHDDTTAISLSFNKKVVYSSPSMSVFTLFKAVLEATLYIAKKIKE